MTKTLNSKGQKALTKTIELQPPASTDSHTKTHQPTFIPYSRKKTSIKSLWDKLSTINKIWSDI